MAGNKLSKAEIVADIHAAAGIPKKDIQCSSLSFQGGQFFSDSVWFQQSAQVLKGVRVILGVQLSNRNGFPVDDCFYQADPICPALRIEGRLLHSRAENQT